jgi:hypothetical protein
MPPLTPDERAALKEDIRANAVIMPVLEDEAGNVIDGFNRVEIWHELRAEGVKVPDYPRIIRPGLTDAEKRTLGRTLNVARRQLTSEQKRQLIGDQLRDTPEQSNRQIAEALGVDDKTVGKRRRDLEGRAEIPHVEVREDRLGRSQPSHKPAIVAKNGVEAKRAQSALLYAPVDALPEKLLDVKRLERVAREHRTAHLKPITGVVQPAGADLRVGDLAEVLTDVPDGSVPLIVTDPPYVESMMEALLKLARLAARVLCDDGLLLAYSGQWFLPRILNDLSSCLDYHWTFALLHAGPCGWINSRHLRVGWKPIVAFTRRGCKCRIRWAEDVIRGDGAQKDLHAWQQGEGEAATLIEKFSDPGETVLEPFLGSGTVAAAAVKLGRRFVGCDINPAAVAITQERLAKLSLEPAESA